MATVPVAELRRRAAALGRGTVVDRPRCRAGGRCPGVELPSAGVALRGDRTAELRAADPPVIARVEHGTTLLDLRTVDPADDPVLAEVLAAVAAG